MNVAWTSPTAYHNVHSWKGTERLRALEHEIAKISGLCQTTLGHKIFVLPNYINRNHAYRSKQGPKHGRYCKKQRLGKLWHRFKLSLFEVCIVIILSIYNYIVPFRFVNRICSTLSRPHRCWSPLHYQNIVVFFENMYLWYFQQWDYQQLVQTAINYCSFKTREINVLSYFTIIFVSNYFLPIPSKQPLRLVSYIHHLKRPS